MIALGWYYHMSLCVEIGRVYATKLLWHTTFPRNTLHGFSNIMLPIHYHNLSIGKPTRALRHNRWFNFVTPLRMPKWEVSSLISRPTRSMLDILTLCCYPCMSRFRLKKSHSKSKKILASGTHIEFVEVIHWKCLVRKRQYYAYSE